VDGVVPGCDGEGRADGAVPGCGGEDQKDDTVPRRFVMEEERGADVEEEAGATYELSTSITTYELSTSVTNVVMPIGVVVMLVATIVMTIAADFLKMEFRID
jgi:hypothetical protein